MGIHYLECILMKACIQGDGIMSYATEVEIYECRVRKCSILPAKGHCCGIREWQRYTYICGIGELQSWKARSPVMLRHASEPDQIGEGLLTLKFEIA